MQIQQSTEINKIIIPDINSTEKIWSVLSRPDQIVLSEDTILTRRGKIVIIWKKLKIVLELMSRIFLGVFGWPYLMEKRIKMLAMDRHWCRPWSTKLLGYRLLQTSKFKKIASQNPKSQKQIRRLFPKLTDTFLVIVV